MDHRRLSLARPAKGTCSWLFEHNVYQNWFHGGDEDRDEGLLLLRGKPGAGKSVLMNEAFRRASTGKHKSPFRTAAFFFNAKGDELESSTMGLYRSLLVQLLPRSPIYLRRLCELHDEQAGDDSWTKVQLESILRLMLNDPLEPITFLFIDAVDECDEGSRSQVTFWHEIALGEGNNVNVCISKRHFPHVSIGRSLIIDVECHNGDDLARYVWQRLEFGMATASLGRRRVVRSRLLAKSDGVFLWAVLILDTILAEWDKGKGLLSLVEMLDEVPSELSDLFRHMFKSIDSVQKPLTLRFFQWAILAKPLRIYEWHDIMAFIRKPVPSSLCEWRSSNNYTESEEQLERMIKSVSLGLVEVKTVTDGEESHGDGMDSISVRAGAGSLDLDRGESRVVQVIHQSVREYFFEKDGFSILESLDHSLSDSGSLGRGYISIMHTCLDYINIKELDALVKARKKAPPDEKEWQPRVDSTATISSSSDQYPNQEPEHTFAADQHKPPKPALPARPQNSTSCRSPELVDANCDYGFPQPVTRHERSKASFEPRRRFSEDLVPDAFGVGDVDETGPSVDILGWLETQSIDASSDYRTASEGLPGASSRASSALGQVLEDHPALLSYALTQFLVHAIMVQGYGSEPNKIIDRLLNGDWDRWVALSEEVPQGASLPGYARTLGLWSWESYINPSRGDPVERPPTPPGGPRIARRDSWRARQREYQKRPGSVKSFGSAGSHR